MNPFVPKPGTPYQWLPMEDPKETDRKLQYLRKAFARMPNVDAICKSARTGAVQSILALGDRRVADALEIAATQGIDLKRALREAGLDAGLLPLPRARARTRSCRGTSSTTGSPRTTSGRSSRRAGRSSSRRTAPRSRAASAAASASRRRTPSTALPEKWKGRGTLPLYDRTLARRDAAGPDGRLTPAGCASSARRRPTPPRPSSTRRRARRPRRCRRRRGRAARRRRRRARSPASRPRAGA